VCISLVVMLVRHLKGPKKKMKQPDSAANEHGDWPTVKTSKLLSSYSPDTVERHGAFQSIKHNVDEMQQAPSMLSR